MPCRAASVGFFAQRGRGRRRVSYLKGERCRGVGGHLRGRCLAQGSPRGKGATARRVGVPRREVAAAVQVGGTGAPVGGSRRGAGCRGHLYLN